MAAAQAELSRYQQTISLLRQPSNRLLSLQGTNVTPTASGSLVIVPKSDVVVLTLQNLTPLPKGQIYRLWAVADSKKYIVENLTQTPKEKYFSNYP